MRTTVFLAFVLTYTFFSAMGFLIGLSSAGYKSCEVKTRGEIFLPTYRLGCYLGEPIE